MYFLEFKFLGTEASPISPALVFQGRAEAESAAQPVWGTQHQGTAPPPSKPVGSGTLRYPGKPNLADNRSTACRYWTNHPLI